MRNGSTVRAPSRPPVFTTRKKVGAFLGWICVAAMGLTAGGEAWSQGEYPSMPAPTFSTTPLPSGRQMHGAAVLGDYLYVIGGASEAGGYTDQVEFARINPDGTLGPWTPTTSIPSPRAYIGNSTLALNDRIYVVGGFDNRTTGAAENKNALKANTAYWSRPGPDGQLSPWQESPSWPGSGMSCLTVVAVPGYLHVLGGYDDGGQPTAAVHSGVVDAEGSVIRWEEGPPLPVQLWFHNAVAVGGRVWVWGGLTTPKNDSVSSRVFSSGIKGDGQLGSWREEMTALPVPYYSAASASAGDYLLAFAPRMAGGATNNDIWFSQVKGGQLIPWQRLTTEMAVTLYVAAAPDYRRGNIYIPSGRIGKAKGFDRNVFYFHLTGAATRDTAGMDVAAASGAPSPAPSSGGMSATATPQRFAFQAAANLSGEAASGFLSYDQARAAAAGPPAKPLLLYFHSPDAKGCREQKTLLQSPEFAPLAGQAAFAWLDLADHPQLVHQLGVYRVPTWALYDARGNPAGQVSNVLTPAQLQQAIASAR